MSFSSGAAGGNADAPISLRQTRAATLAKQLAGVPRSHELRITWAKHDLSLGLWRVDTFGQAGPGRHPPAISPRVRHPDCAVAVTGPHLNTGPGLLSHSPGDTTTAGQRVSPLGPTRAYRHQHVLSSLAAGVMQRRIESRFSAWNAIIAITVMVTAKVRLKCLPGIF